MIWLGNTRNRSYGGCLVNERDTVKVESTPDFASTLTKLKMVKIPGL